MKKVINVVKKAAKWYFEQSSKNYTWLVSGTIPLHIEDKSKNIIKR